MDTKFNFTAGRLNSIPAPEKGRAEYFDTTQRGLCLRVTSSGKKTFRLNVWDKNKKRPARETIGEYPHVRISDARDLVAKRISELAEGINTVERRRKEREELTLNEVFEIWLTEHAKPNLKRWKEEERRYDLYIRDRLGNRRISDITPEAVQRWKLNLSKQKKERDKSKTLSPGVVHRAFIVLSSIFGKAAPNTPNPCRQVDKYKAKKRTVFMKSEDLEKFFSGISSEETPEWLRDYLLLCLYTGARQANMLSMRWMDLDLRLKLWIIPGEQVKNSEDTVVPLLDKAVEILERRKEKALSIFVFPSEKSKTGHKVNIRRPWKELLKRSGIETPYTLHDIRRTMGSWQAISGSSTKLIGASLGHKSEQATAHYAHLTIDPVRASMEKAVKNMERSAGEKKIVSIKKR